ncbi:MAG: glycosyltransferase family 4 protein [Hyphomicrobiales bacterium]|nr:glycosyltransferase family 4 protein [Rickettsiales bacterium]MCP5361707.1 glycosyltransferase family 4 protein [Hyphomicrobiales bacterium]
MEYAIAFFCAATLTGAIVPYLIRFLHARQVMDIPNARSNHTLPTPRGGGLAVIPAIVIVSGCFALWQHSVNHDLLILLTAVTTLALISFLDDLYNLSAVLRLIIQIVVISACTFLLFPTISITNGYLPPILEKLILIGTWLWFVNLYNFMDGIDGITGSETLLLGLGSAVILMNHQQLGIPLIVAFPVAGAALGFLVWNWHPAKIFLGDVGSIPLGFLVGWLMLSLADHGYWTAAMLLPAYYLADSSLTLLRRLLAGKPIWKPHSEHFYQQAIRKGLSHHRVTLTVATTGLGLWLLGFASTYWPQESTALLFTAGLLVCYVLFRFRSLK